MWNISCRPAVACPWGHFSTAACSTCTDMNNDTILNGKKFLIRINLAYPDKHLILKGIRRSIRRIIRKGIRNIIPRLIRKAYPKAYSDSKTYGFCLFSADYPSASRSEAYPGGLSGWAEIQNCKLPIRVGLFARCIERFAYPVAYPLEKCLSELIRIFFLCRFFSVQ